MPRTFLRVVAANKRVEWLIGGKGHFSVRFVCLLVIVKPSDTILHAPRLALFVSKISCSLSKLTNRHVERKREKKGNAEALIVLYFDTVR